MEGTMAEVRMFGGNFAPRNWAFCEGQLLSVSQYNALFSLLGTIYGGDGRTTFALPDLRGRVPVGSGTGSGLQAMKEGQHGGTNTNTLNVTNLPSHNHTVNSNIGTTGRNLQTTPKNNYPAQNADGSGNYAPSSENVMNAQMIGMTGNNQAVNNMQPYLAVNYIICLQGEYPQRS